MSRNTQQQWLQKNHNPNKTRHPGSKPGYQHRPKLRLAPTTTKRGSGFSVL